MRLFFTVPVLLLLVCRQPAAAQVKDVFYPLPANDLKFTGFFENDLRNSLTHWNKGVLPYAELASLYRDGRKFFAQGEMWGKAVRSGCMFYRYTHDAELKRILQQTVQEVLHMERSNGSISCSPVEKQPDGPGGDLWERKYVMLAMEGYYADVDADTAVLHSLVRQADAVLAQTGPAPKVPITDQGWSPNHIESSTILEPMMRLYKMTGYPRYLDFARYIVEEAGGAKGYRIFDQALQGNDPANIGGVYPKAYEMMSLFEGLVEYYRVTGNEKWKKAALNLFAKIKQQEITLIGNGGGDMPHHPAVMGEAWDYTATEQTNPDVQRMMETCAGVTWLKLCSQLLMLTGDASAADYIERYAYNGLIGAMKPEGDGFSYVNLLNGVKTNITGWGGTVGGVPVTCCNLNGPMGLAYLPYVAIVRADSGPVINLYNSATASVQLSSGREVHLAVEGSFPSSGEVSISVDPARAETFSMMLRIPAWSVNTVVSVNGHAYAANPGTYLTIRRKWKRGDKISIGLDMRCRLVDAPHGTNRKGDHFQALVAGPIVLARDEHMDSNFDRPVTVQAVNGYVSVRQEQPSEPGTRVQFVVPTTDGPIHMIDYASVNNWDGKRVCTWLPQKTDGQ